MSQGVFFHVSSSSSGVHVEMSKKPAHSAAFVTLFEQSRALGESHAIPDTLLLFQKQVSVVSGRPSSVVLPD